MDGGGEASVKHAGCKKYVVELCVGYGNFRMNELISCRVCVFAHRNAQGRRVNSPYRWLVRHGGGVGERTFTFTFTLYCCAGFLLSKEHVLLFRTKNVFSVR